ncbi:hypothetical protein BH18THE2_BH18THE2_23330 [soil metagenome]
MNKIHCKAKDYDGFILHCPNPRCDYTWRYLGRFSFYATCPSCRRNIKISENKIESLQPARTCSPKSTEPQADDTPEGAHA